MSTTVAQGQSCPQPSFFEKNKFTVLRNIAYLTVIFLLIVLPTFNIVKIDIARNQSFIFGKPVSLAEGLAPVIFAGGIFAILVIVLNLILGRVFCGWICPGGWFAELQEKFRRMWWTPTSKSAQKITYILFTVITSILFSLLFLNWVTDLRVFFYETNPSFIPMWLVFLGMTGIFYFELFIGKRWCRVFCPTGIYQKITPYHHLYKPTLVNVDACTDCRECVKNCPMALDPRRMAYINDFYKGIAACIECYNCIDSCTKAQSEKCLPVAMGIVKELPPRDPDFISGKSLQKH
ncbi:4Fe-4S binding protein [Sulfurihydrogenibium subterraneum]|uniref:4Fe-4S binding protein n=1 Tax=Sulfurihydrogenibium subterraneum TaxID=171121 RepID=UPI00048C4E42|nr:4Fe-4S binding protein [Sulfurihydrogenibium subterraneum]